MLYIGRHEYKPDTQKKSRRIKANKNRKKYQPRAIIGKIRIAPCNYIPYRKR